MIRTIKIILGKDKLNPSTLFNPFKHRRLSMWRVFFQNLRYELFWRWWYRDPDEQLRRVHFYAEKLEKRIVDYEKRISELEGQRKWYRGESNIPKVIVENKPPRLIKIPSAQEIKRQIDLRNSHRKDKKYAEADKIRDTLADQGVILEDTPTATTWRCEQKWQTD